MKRGFTLIELLVVITIIVVLLSLLTPALDRAIYQAELVVCATNLRQVGSGSVTYAAAYKRKYPYRQGAANESGWEPHKVYNGFWNRDVDDRVVFETFISIKALNDPLAPDPEVDFSVEGNEEETGVYVCKNLWMSYRYKPGAGGGNGMIKIGDRLSSNDYDGMRRKYNLLAGDDFGHSYALNGVHGEHQDKDGTMTGTTIYNENFGFPGLPGVAPITQTRSQWSGADTVERGLVDAQYVHADTSTTRITDMEVDDERTALTPQWNAGPNEVGNADAWIQLPIR